MSLIKCPECKNKISEKAISCPKCGYILSHQEVKKIKETEKETKYGVIIFLIIVITYLIFNLSKSDVKLHFVNKDKIITKYSKTKLNVREKPSTNSDIIKTLMVNEKIITFDTIVNNFTIVLNSDSTLLGWSSDKYLQTIPLSKKQLNRTKNTSKIAYNKSEISNYSIEKIEDLSMKATTKNLSAYSTAEIQKLPIDKRIEYTIIVPTKISKKSLENTLKYFVAKKTLEDNNIDEIIIFAYDRKNDIDITPYTYAKLIWAPKGKLGNVTPQIAKTNNRSNYRFNIHIKDNVGNTDDTLTKRELAIYDMIMDPKYTSLSDDELDKKVMRKFNIKTKEELDRIFIKVLKHYN